MIDPSITGHDPVLLAEVLEYLDLSAGQTFVDCTLGAGDMPWPSGSVLEPGGFCSAWMRTRGILNLRPSGCSHSNVAGGFSRPIFRALPRCWLKPEILR